MSRLTQLGVFCVVLGGVVLILGLFPSAVGADGTPGIGIAQIIAILVGLTLLVMGAYVIVYAILHRGNPRTLRHDIGIRLGFTGLVFAYSAMLADVFGFGSHNAADGVLLGWLQATGMLMGFGVSAIGVLIYGSVRPSVDAEKQE